MEGIETEPRRGKFGDEGEQYADLFSQVASIT
jgi:hypothetical protein